MLISDIFKEFTYTFVWLVINYVYSVKNECTKNGTLITLIPKQITRHLYHKKVLNYYI